MTIPLSHSLRPSSHRDGSVDDHMTQHPNDLLEDYALHLLPATVEQSVAEHLAGCADCRQRVDSLERALGLLAYAAPHALPPEDAEERLLQRVNALRRAEVS